MAELDIESLAPAELTVEYEYGGKRGKVTATDPCNTGVLILYEENVKKFVGTDEADRLLWTMCRVMPETIRQPERFRKIPTDVKIQITQGLLEKLGYDRFFSAQSKAMADAVGQALDKALPQLRQTSGPIEQPPSP